MGRPEADHDPNHDQSSSNQAFHQTHCEQESEKPQQHQVISPPNNPSHRQTYALGRRLSNAENEQEQSQHSEHVTPLTSSGSSQEIQTQQQQAPYHENMRYYFPTPIPHHGTNLSWHNFPSQYAPQGPLHHFQAMSPRPHPMFYPSPTPPPPPVFYNSSSPLNNYSHSTPFNNYSGSPNVQQVVLCPPPAAYYYPSGSRNPYVHYNHTAATGIPMMQNLQYVPVIMPPHSGTGEGSNWKTGLFDCVLDPPNAILTWFLPCWTLGRIAEIVDHGQTACNCNALIYLAICCFIGVPCLLSCTYRRKLRIKFDLPESPGPDCLIHFLCEPCALCQAHRELEIRGFDPSLGWVGRMEQLKRDQEKRQATTTSPPTTQRMTAY